MCHVTEVMVGVNQPRVDISPLDSIIVIVSLHLMALDAPFR